MRTTLESFYKDASEDSLVRKKQQEELRKRMDGLYAQFEVHSWHWCNSVEFESKFLELPPRDQEKVGAICASYGNNLSKTTAALDPVWGALVSGSGQRTQQTSDLLVKSHKALDDLAQERGQIVAELINVFAK
jgi:hypothetical protein